MKINPLTNEIAEEAYAKLNITLDVTAARQDGYHDMCMVMQTVSVCDRIRISLNESGEIRAISNVAFLPGDNSNLAVKAARCFFQAMGEEGFGADIVLKKHIPIGAGMAGGSADAAAVLRGLNRAFGMPYGRKTLCGIGEKVGSDVPFCVAGGTMLAEGRGEILTPLPDLPDCTFVICKPDFSISTPELFRKLDEAKLHCHPDTDGVLAALKNGNLTGICRRMYNVFEDVDDRRMRTVREIRSVLLDGGASGAIMTGTGSAVFGVFTDAAAAERTASALKKQYSFAETARPVGPLVR